MRRLTLGLAVMSALSAVVPASGGVPPASVGAAGAGYPLDALERRVQSDPESLQVAAEYRQQVIAAGAYDRAIALFERLSKRPGAGAHAFVNLALAYVDKVPVSGSIRQALLGRDAIRALSRSIALAPSELAFFVRGLINLYYDRAIFHRTEQGVADLEEARRLTVTAHADAPYMPRILQTLGDGYFRLDQRDKARQTWRDGLVLAPDNEPLRRRLAASDEGARSIIAQALNADVRVDTSLRELKLTEATSPGGGSQ
jgi:tetratricopeptide (TPR) repeat protein